MDNKIVNRIHKDFTQYDVDSEQLEAMTIIRKSVLKLALTIGEVVPEGREQSLALTKLQECSMWANRGISIPQVPDDR